MQLWTLLYSCIVIAFSCYFCKILCRWDSLLRLSGFNVGLQLCHGLLPLVLKSLRRVVQRWIDKMNLILGQVASPSLWQDIPEVVILQGTWRILHSRRILHAPSIISVHDGLWSVMSLETEWRGGGSYNA